MLNLPERQLDPPDHWTCEECGGHFYPGLSKEPGEDERVICHDCATFDG
tara:strand:- start:328 stop:474 length:147 start_codon:yes stop_codon:yes gene_type:complete